MSKSSLFILSISSYYFLPSSFNQSLNDLDAAGSVGPVPAEAGVGAGAGGGVGDVGGVGGGVGFFFLSSSESSLLSESSSPESSLEPESSPESESSPVSVDVSPVCTEESLLIYVGFSSSAKPVKASFNIDKYLSLNLFLSDSLKDNTWVSLS